MTSRWGNPIANNYLEDKEGNLLPGGTVDFYEAGTSTPLAVYSDPDLSVSLGSQITADDNGMLPDFHLAAGTAYKSVGKDSGGITKWTRDDVFSLDSSVDARLDSLEATINALDGLTLNGILNGGMRVADGADGTLATSFAAGKVAGFYAKAANVTAGSITQGTSSTFESGYFSLLSGVSMSGAGDVVAQMRIDGREASRYTDGAATFSCDVFHDLGASVTFTAYIKKPSSSLNGWGSLATIATGTGTPVPNLTTSAVTVTSSDVGDVSNGLAVEVVATVASSISAKNLRFGDFKLESGGSVTSFNEQQYRASVAALGFGSKDARLSDPSISNGTDTEHDIDISAGSIMDSANSSALITGGLTKQIDASWAAGTNAGGFPSALTLSADTWYRVFLIGKTDGTVDAGFDTSSTAANLLSDATGYTLYRRIGSVLTGNTSNILEFRQDGDYFQFNVPFEAAAWSLSTSAANVVVGAPPNSVAHLSFELSVTAGNTVSTVVRHPDGTDVAASATSFTFTRRAPGAVDDRGSHYVSCPVNGSSQVSVRSSGIAGAAGALMSLGWTDRRAS